jgi:DNA invertase Pin-like site-specific DNA recombinase
MNQISRLDIGPTAAQSAMQNRTTSVVGFTRQPANRFVAYYRVSTAEQGRSGLGLDAQRAAVLGWLNGSTGKLAAEFTEIESGKVNARPQLLAAMEHCRLTGARLVIAKLDRLGRNVAFLATLMEGDVEFVACDNSTASKLTLHILAAVAEAEREMIAARTKAALAAAKARGTRLGGWRATTRDGGLRPRAGAPGKATEAAVARAAAFAAKVGPIALRLRQGGLSLAAVARELSEQYIASPRGGAWTATAVRNLLRRTIA